MASTKAATNAVALAAAIKEQRSKFNLYLREAANGASVPASLLLAGLVCGVADHKTLAWITQIERAVRWEESDADLIHGFQSHSAALAAAFLWAPARFERDCAVELVTSRVGLCIVDDDRRRAEFPALLATFADPSAICAELLSVLAGRLGPAGPARGKYEQLLRQLVSAPPASKYPQRLLFA